MKISEHFNREEFACSCGCQFKAVDKQLLDILEDLRGFFKQPITINSACRCEAHNEAIGGSKNSQHIKGMACDVVVKNTPSYEVYNYLNNSYRAQLGLGQYDSFTHLDVRTTKTRWDKRIKG